MGDAGLANQTKSMIFPSLHFTTSIVPFVSSGRETGGVGAKDGRGNAERGLLLRGAAVRRREEEM